MMQDVWPAPPGTASKDKTNVRLGIAYVEFTSWAKEFHVERLGTIIFFVWYMGSHYLYVHAICKALPAGVLC